ncbi:MULTISPECIES: hypothetical protein [Micromonospora]|uniref:Uncharacterized protein n=1 Tax=Micromonospora solifontis TaxID=2487138 RepID=A0ABX9WNH2_9ACTN|nr:MULTISPECIES: hypothetical protein [Micromonospora]NES14601.1 hypothetical protein [Micromonospora sp. PPF5-17B]NES35261.1 hypothetical protein [Micromonospora solifontis]RNM00988.1 hypothetical protein EFE23_03660 [Micromonospora solifontis]
MEWRTRWQITIRWDRADNSPAGVTVVEHVVDSPAELRQLVARARADRHVVAFPYCRVRELVGDEPQHCRNGHSYVGGSATRPVRDWLPCSCGGHLALRCARCPDVRVDPDVSADCNPSTASGGQRPTA